MRTRLDGVDPVVVRGGVIRRTLERLLNQRDLLFLLFLRLAVVVVAVAQRAGEEELRLKVIPILFDDLPPNGCLFVVSGSSSGPAAFTASSDAEVASM
jgi:hypothetical protein